MNDTDIDTHNTIFRTMRELNTRQQHTHRTPLQNHNQKAYTQQKGKKSTQQKT
jgi:hypothetical protein